MKNLFVFAVLLFAGAAFAQETTTAPTKDLKAKHETMREERKQLRELRREKIKEKIDQRKQKPVTE